MILKEALWSAPEQRSEIGRMAARLANPLNAKAVELSDQVDSAFSAFNEAQATAANKTEQMNSAVDTNVKIKDALENFAPSSNRPSTVPTDGRIDKVIPRRSERQAPRRVCKVILG
jgi:hypothetical protein